MPAENPLKHIRIEGHVQTDQYVSPRRPGPRSIQTRDRVVHGGRIKDQLNAIKLEFEGLHEVELPEGIVRDDAVYVEFISDFNFELAFDSFQNDDARPKYVLLNSRLERVDGHERYRVNVMLTEGGISHFIKKVDQYLNQNTRKEGIETDSPRNRALINNIEQIQMATLEAFWTEPSNVQFPGPNDYVWWEVWFRRIEGADENQERNRVIEQLAAVGADVGLSEITFPEHTIRLVKATSTQLSNSLFLLDNLAELRKPKETADFFMSLSIRWSEDALADLQDRIDNHTNENSLAICLLDSGVQNRHPLLTSFFRENSLHSIKPADWGTADGWPNDGHGTGMAGISLYGNLSEVLSSPDRVSIFHQLESVKIINNHDPHDPELYAKVTEDAVSQPVVMAPQRPRVYCMAVTDKDQSFFGRPSSWSASLDKITFGSEEEGRGKELFLVASGNVWLANPEEYPSKNHVEGVHDPGQAFNAITVGGYTDMDTLDPREFPNAEVLVRKGGMAPSNSTSMLWETQWPIKPDIVMEGGNMAVEGGNLIKPHSLQLLSTGKNFRVNTFQAFGDSSSAVALASRFAALLKNEYPNLWPETIRGLMVHSADWNSTMLNGNSLQQLGALRKDDKGHLLRTFGYGVPNLEKALYSANNCLTLIAEQTISPFKKEQSQIKFNEIQYFELPWPIEVLQNELAELDVKLNITLSYYIEPNPGNRMYGSKFSYQSHSLRFNVIKPNEDFETFQQRVNQHARDEGNAASFPGENWVMGEQLHTKGSIHRDFWIGSGADLALRNRIAIRPGVGWYRTRKRLAKYDDLVRYSLIVSIETAENDVDIYTPVLNQIPIPIRN